MRIEREKEKAEFANGENRGCKGEGGKEGKDRDRGMRGEGERNGAWRTEGAERRRERQSVWLHVSGLDTGGQRVSAFYLQSISSHLLFLYPACNVVYKVYLHVVRKDIALS